MNELWLWASRRTRRVASYNFSHLSDGALKTVVEYASKVPLPHCEIFIGLLGGQASRAAPDETAYSHRNAKFVLNVHSRRERAEEDASCISWARDFFNAAAPYATGGVYVNFLTQDETDRGAAAYGPEAWRRPVEVKNKWDPKNVFRINQNVKPSI